MPQRGSRSVTLPAALLARIERLIHGSPELGFATPTEFVRHAIRLALEREEPHK